MAKKYKDENLKREPEEFSIQEAKESERLSEDGFDKITEKEMQEKKLTEIEIDKIKESSKARSKKLTSIESKEKEDKIIEELLKVAEERGESDTILMLKEKYDDPYILDRFHDRLLEEIKKGREFKK